MNDNNENWTGPPGPWAVKRPERAWIVLGLTAVLLLSWHFGYKVGADMAKRENYRDCVAAGQVDCKRR